MTREETKRRFQAWCQSTIGNYCTNEDEQMFNNIMAMLESQPCGDAISRQAVIDELEKSHMTSGVKNQGTWNECVDSMTRTIKDLPPINPQPCKDAISREWLKTAIHNFYDGLKHTPTEEDIQAYIDYAPPVNPQPKTGRWKYDYTTADGHRTYHCSECGCYLKPKHSEPLNSFKWCSLCGAKMIEPQESEG